MNITFQEIVNRKSVRTFDKKPLEPAQKEELVAFIYLNPLGPFGSTIKFELIDLSSAGAEELKKFASYGNIKGAMYIMAGAVKETMKAMLDYGYLMEKNILACQALGIGTVWVGGTFNRAGFISKINAKFGEIIPAVVPLGYASANRDIADISTRTAIAADTRKPWKDIFFNESPDKPLAEESAGSFKVPLSALRLSPSASNKQPWRIVKTGDKLHLFLERTPNYRQPPRADIQMMDMGIAMCSFDIAAEEQGLKGKWEIESGIKGLKNWEYIASR